MRRSIFRAVIASAFVLPGYASANDLIENYRKALEQDTTVRAAKFQRDASIEARPQALAALLPQLTAQGSLTEQSTTFKQSSQRFTSDPTQPNQPPVASGTTTTTTTYSNQGSNYQVNLTQTIWSFEQWRLLKQADSTVALAEATYRSAQQDLILRVAQAYFSVLSAADNVRTSTAEKTANERQLQQAQKRFEVGLAAITDVQEAQAAFDTSNATLITADRTLQNAKRALGEITGDYGDNAQGLVEVIPTPAPDASVDQWLETAKQSNYTLQIAEYNTDVAKKGVGVAFARHYPSLQLQGSYGGNFNSSTRNSDSTQGSIGIGLSVPIFSGGLIQSQVRQAEATYNQNLALLEGTTRSIERQTRDAYQGVISGIAVVQANLQSVKSNQTALASSQVGLQVGTRTEVDVLTTLRTLYEAQRTYYQSRYDYLISVLTLKQQAGRLTESDLANIDGLLVPPEAIAPVVVPTAATTPR